MQLALNVNTALMALMRANVFCTEPFRVPLAGKISACLFDKTGTLTTDQLEAVGVSRGEVSAAQRALVATGAGEDESSRTVRPPPMLSASAEATLVLAGCHSLVYVDGKLAGDPIEVASLKAVCWKYDDAHSMCRPRPGSDSRFLGSGAFISIVKRHHFSSRLQRMSVVAELSLDGGKKRNASLVKGSPEMIRTLLNPGDIPPWYDAEHRALSRAGLRVIALAYRFHEEEDGQVPMHERPRAWVESNLRFAGFVSFRCAVRSDTAEVVAKLHASSHSVVMVTGDAMLTAVFVAREIKIVPDSCAGVLILAYEDVDGSGAQGGVVAADDAGKALLWRNALTDKVVEAYNDGEGSFRELAERFKIGEASVNRYVSLARRNGTTAPKKMGGYRKPLRVTAEGEVWLRELVGEQPSLSLPEMSALYARASETAAAPHTVVATRSRQQRGAGSARAQTARPLLFEKAAPREAALLAMPVPKLATRLQPARLGATQGRHVQLCCSTTLGHAAGTTSKLSSLCALF